MTDLSADLSEVLRGAEGDVVIVVLAGSGRLTTDGRTTDLAPHVVACVPRASLRTVEAADGRGLDYLSIHRRRAPLAIGPAPDEGGDPACWAHLFPDT